MILTKWIRIALFNLLLVSLIGVTLRSKIIFSLPFIDQKHLLHGHSHFAFAGWVTQILMALMVDAIGTQKNKNLFLKYRWLLYGNLITAYGMLLSFPLQGYGVFPICFSTLSIFVSYFFAACLWKEINIIPQKQVSHLWFKASLIWSALSSIGAFALAFMIAAKTVHQNWYLAAVYFFLHFQYNGWFLFACMGLLFSQLHKANITHASFSKIFWLFALACVPAYLLSTLWMHLPLWIYLLVVVAALMQVIGWILFIQNIRTIKAVFSNSTNIIAISLLTLSVLAFSIKLLLQLGSTIPSLSDLAFGFRPIVIGYLHLVLLGVITMFILGYCFFLQPTMFNNINRKGIVVFAFGVVLNEFLLMLQGVTFMGYIIIPYGNEALLFAALILFTGLLMLNFHKSANKFVLT
jgi:hypothetical protein